MILTANILNIDLENYDFNSKYFNIILEDYDFNCQYFKY